MSENQIVEKKPYRNYTWFVFVVVIALAFMIWQSIYAIRGDFFDTNEGNWFILWSLIGGYIAYTITYNIGKYVFGKISHFRFVSIDLFILRITRIEGKLQYDLCFPDGWGGSCLMAPKENSKPMLYHFGGLITNLIISVVSSSIFLLVDPSKKLGYISLVFAVVGLIVLVANLMPFYTDGVSDGFVIRLLLNKKNKEPYLDNLLQEEALLTGYGEIKEYTYTSYNDTFEAESLVYLYYYYMDKKVYNKAEEVCDKMIGNERYLTSEHRCLAHTAKLYFLLLRESDEFCYDYYYSLEREYRNFAISTDRYDCLKVGLLVASKIEKTFDLYDHIQKNIKKCEERYYFTRKEVEHELVEKSLKTVKDNHPDWFIEE